MTAPVLAGIGVLGGLGAVARFALSAGAARRWPGPFPVGTFVVNISGAFALGLLVGAAPSQDTLRLAGTGFLGAYTTFSTWMLELHDLAEDSERRTVAAYLVGSLAAGLAAAAFGRHLTM